MSNIPAGFSISRFKRSRKLLLQNKPLMARRGELQPASTPLTQREIDALTAVGLSVAERKHGAIND